MTHDQLIEDAKSVRATDAKSVCTTDATSIRTTDAASVRATDTAAAPASSPPEHAQARGGFPLLTDAIDESSVSLFEENLRRGAKPAAEWMCGIEFELFGYDARRGGNLARLNPAQVQGVLAGFAPSSDDLVYEGSTIVEANAGQMNRLTVEPGGQIEFSGAPQRKLADVEREVVRYLTRLREIAEAENFVFLAAGFDPLRTIDEQSWFPKMRYDVMRPYLAKRGARAWDMMTRTCAVQANLDYGTEDDLARKFLVGNRLAPISTAIFANSPFENGRPSGYKSTRAAAWLATDADRTGIAPPALGEQTFSPAAFIAYALEVPMLFAQRGGRYTDAPTGMKFADFLAQADAAHKDAARADDAHRNIAHGDIAHRDTARADDVLSPVFGDWADHLTTIFTDARLKQHIELRSADCGSLAHALAFQAYWKGLLYCPEALAGALSLAPALDAANAFELRAAVARDALQARAAGVNVLALAKESIALAVEGLRRVAPEELPYLDPLRQQVVADEVSPADILLGNWHGSWHASMPRVFEYLRIA
ncbi:MAG TPA: glutamate-cysteine ligase family protein [Pyrinomonadaceae bacterium]|nr:glutamate-cysteine ligase family protein [Pyrinomonadaceae bacterium]